MKVRSNVVDELLSPLRQYFQKDTLTREGVNENPPLRSELFSADQMEQHARSLASAHRLRHEQAPEQLLKRLADNEEMLTRVTALLQETVREKKGISPAGEWLLDNFYLIEEQIRAGKRYLPKGYSKGLPKLKDGRWAGYPRVYEIAIEIISHSDGHVDINSLTHFIEAYQLVSHLTLGELWAIPIMLRLALLENLSRVAARIAIDRIDTTLANRWAGEIIKVAEHNPKDLVLVMADMARSHPPMVSAFVAEFARKIQWKGMDLTLPMTWIEQHLSGTNQNINAMVLAENQKQAADQLSVSNSINSLRFLAKIGWREFVEAMSVVEHTLQLDEIYPRMDFYTRDSYRYQVERIAKRSLKSEKEVAQIAIDLAQESPNEESIDKRKSHVGYYLIGKGRAMTERRAQAMLTGLPYLKRLFHKAAGSLYISTILLLTLAISYGLISKAHNDGVNGSSLLIVGICSLFGGSQLAIALVNWWVTLWKKPGSLPKMNFSSGIPPESRTLVVVPTLVTDKKQADKLADDLEVRFLANRDPNLFFALLTDFSDAREKTMPGDDILVTQLKNRIEEMNERYGSSFYLFHRPRTFNPAENLWMGYERKRGKLTALNQLLRGKREENFSVRIGDASVYSSIKYVITLDTDTQLPRDAAWKLIGLMSHPLNKPSFDPRKKRVTEGYGIIQPRIAISLHGATRSRYTSLNENDSGIDPYTHVTSDVYQDVFGEGSFIGKGIYDIDAFETAIANRFPKNRILSHDLLEGSYARCGFASDIQLYEEIPSTYQSDISRRHRWIRGDWQIWNWFLPFVPSKGGSYEWNPISGLSRWKIADNLRRSLVPATLVTLLIMSWTVLPSAWFWTLGVTTILLLPSVLMSMWMAVRKPKEIDLGQHLNNTIGVTHKSIQQALFTLLCLPYEAFINLDAVIRTLWRLLISQRHLLEWRPSGFISNQKEDLPATILKMAIAPLAAVSLIQFVGDSPPALFWSSPYLLLWICSPLIAWWVSLPVPAYRANLSQSQKNYLRGLSRKTWSFFEDFVGPEDNWLPPDNLQQYPVPVLAHRTSPTNMGLALLANLSAWDFRYVSTGQLIDRTSRAFESMGKLDRYLGHFYNWYDTQTLKKLHPHYISTVDSGNLAAHLLTLRQGLLEIPNRQVFDAKLFEGLADTLRMTIENAPDHLRAGLAKMLMTSEGFSTRVDASLFDIHDSLENLSTEFHRLLDPGANSYEPEMQEWIVAFENQVAETQRELKRTAPWLDLLRDQGKIQPTSPLLEIPSLTTLSSMDSKWAEVTASMPQNEDIHDSLQSILKEASRSARERIQVIQQLAAKCFEFADMEYNFIYDKSERLLAIGYSVDERKRDPSSYDLLASEARLSAFVGIAQGKLPQESWFALGRRLTTTNNTSVLLSWSGSMFEYLMPVLVMPTYENTLLDETYKSTVDRQIDYGRQQNVPWGISESCYNMVDSSHTYQYRAFGVPGLGFSRGLGQDLVIAPYATVLSLMIRPHEAYDNLRKLRDEGFEGRYGFYEAIDYTPVRLLRGQSNALIKSFMVHHQGMSLLSLAYLLLDKPMQRRFESDAQFQTALLLLQEQVPRTTGFYTATADKESITPGVAGPEMRIIKTPDTSVPEVQLLSNGRYHVMVTNAGGGYSRWKDLAVTRWREDGTRDNWGSFCFIKDLTSSEYWSITHQPSLKEAKSYEAIFSQGRVEFRRRDEDIETYTEIIVSPEDDIEVRRVHLANHSRFTHKLEITSYSEVVLALPGVDAAHPAFSNLFVQTEINEIQHAVRCTRRPRSKDEQPPWMIHLMKINGVPADHVAYETDRSKFIGRGNELRAPQALQVSGLSGSQGSVLDPIVSIQYKITLGAGESATLDMVTGISATREGSQALIDKYQDKHLRDRAFELSWTHSQVVLRQIGATEADAQIYGKLAGSVIFPHAALRAQAGIIGKNQRGQSALWSHSISGDLPIVLLQISSTENISLVRQMIKAQAYWQLKGLSVDLVILNEDPSGYRQVLQDQIQGLIAAGIVTNTTERPGRLFVKPIDQVSMEDRILLQSVARVIISDSMGTLADQVNKRMVPKNVIPPFVTSRTTQPVATKPTQPPPLQFFNGTGGFSGDGNEYVIVLKENQTTPLPWSNVIANRSFGTMVTESGPAYTWSENAHEYRLTPWTNDPVTNDSGEAYYMRDEESGLVWSPTPSPARGKAPYIIRHGFGYSLFEHVEDGISTECIVYVDMEAPVRFVAIKVRNQSGRSRKLSTTGYAEWVLASLRQNSAMHIVTSQDTETGAILARNAYNTEFDGRVAFMDVDDIHFHFTADRSEFIGRNGTLRQPECMRRVKLSGKSGAGLDPCAAIQVPFVLGPDEERDIVFRIGSGRDQNEALDIIKRFKGKKAAADALARVHNHWKSLLGIIQVETPDQSLNILTNGWLVYQVLTCRLWGRTGFYQSGGAFGFRDQLQDVLAMLYADPLLARNHILLAASRQFREGDVQHWWHPPHGRGVRTLCSDDYLWLPYVACRYITTTGDKAILEEQIPFLQGRPLNDQEESYYDLPIASDQRATLYEHCRRALLHALRFGKHGLPLIGSGDWNDGMNMVGIQGKGESVWLGFFLFEVLTRFAVLARLRGDLSVVSLCEQHAEKLKENISKHAWDGQWYRRAYFDDGTPLGSVLNKEGKIDALVQSWSVLSGAGDPEHAATAMISVYEKLVNREKKLIRLLDPPFDQATVDPGYIKGYVPGVRENGGQYTHAAIWVVMAFAKLGDRTRTAELLRLINPIHHGGTPGQIAVYKTEPYVIPADVYGVPPHAGRGGWTWYTGSAGWMYQLILESFLGFRQEGNILRVEPAVPADWNSFTVHYRYKKSTYHITVLQETAAEIPITVDGIEQPDKFISLLDDGQEHTVLVRPRLKQTALSPQPQKPFTLSV